jgi:hypothetical protein
MGLRKLGAGCPTGPALSPGRWLGLGGTCAPPLAPHFQCVLPLRRQSHRSRGYFPGSFPASIPDSRQLPLGTRRICHVDDQRHKKFADRSLPPNEARPANRLSRRCHARCGEQGVGGAAAGSASAVERIERPSTIGVDTAFTGIARGGCFAGPATTRLCGDPASAGGARRHGKVSHQSRAHRVGKDFAPNGREAFMTARVNTKGFVILGTEETLSVGVEL